MPAEPVAVADRVARLPPPGSPDALYLVDLSGYVFRAYHALPPLSSSRGEPTHAVLGTVNMLQKIVGERRPHMLGVAMDSRGPTFRHAVDARYKSTRPTPPADLSQQMARVEEIVRAWDVACFHEDGLEADDLIASVARRAMAEGLTVVIVSSDKDLLQIVHDEDQRIVMWDSMRDKVYGAAEVREKYGVPPSRMRDFLALTGDTSDNVPGVPGVGPKTAADLLQRFGSVDAVYAALDQVGKPKLRESLRAYEVDARVSLRLVTLDDDVPITWARERLLWGGADLGALRRIYAELEFGRQLAQLEALMAAEGVKESATGGAGVRGEPTKPTRVYDCILHADALAGLIASARARGYVGIGIESSARDEMRGEIIGVSLAVEPGQAHYVPIQHRYLGCPPQLSWDAARSALAPLFGDGDVVKVGHDLKRIRALLAIAHAPIAGPCFDTMIAAYLLDPEASNALKDVARRELEIMIALHEDVATKKTRGAAALFDELDVESAATFAGSASEVSLALRERMAPRLSAEGLDRLMNEVEMPLERVLADIEMRGVLVDVEALERLGRAVEEQLRTIEADCKGILGHDFAVRSRDQLERILFDELKLPVVKRTPKGGRSTDADVLEALAERHPLARRILEFRELDKLKGTYIDALPRAVNPVTGRIHTRFDQAVAATGRLSSRDPNLQNIPVRTELGRSIRATFVAAPGCTILSADYSQIELRVLAHLAGDPVLIEAFESGEDVHRRTAALIFDKKSDEVLPEERRAAKTINFGVIYGMGEGALATQLGIAREQAARFIAAYFERYAGVARFMTRTIEQARQGEAVRTLLGRRRFLPNLHSANRALRLEAERIARNTPIQGTAADILKLAMVALFNDPVTARAPMILTVHDELVFEVPASDVEKTAAAVRTVMAGVVELAVPLVVDVGWGESWADAH